MLRFGLGTRSTAAAIVAIVALLLVGTRVAHAQIVISEVMYDPVQKSDKGYEWIELTNIGSQEVQVSNIRFVEAGVRHLVKSESGGESIPPGRSAVVVQNGDAFLSEYPSYAGIMLASSFSLRQKGGVGETLGIYDTEKQETVFQFTYTPDEMANGTGVSLHIDGGNQIVGPPTPGLPAINPIVLPDKEEREEEELPVIQEELPADTESSEALLASSGEPPAPNTRTAASDGKIETIPGTARQQATEQSQEPQRLVERQVAHSPADSTPILIWIAGILTVIALELLALLSMKIYRHRDPSDSAPEE